MSGSALVVGKISGRPRNGDNGGGDRGYRRNFAGFFRDLAWFCSWRREESIGRGMLVGGRLGLPDGSLEVDSTRRFIFCLLLWQQFWLPGVVSVWMYSNAPMRIFVLSYRSPD